MQALIRPPPGATLLQNDLISGLHAPKAAFATARLALRN
jgi:hypothetical protein